MNYNQSEFDFMFAEIYGKKNCKHCYGRGYVRGNFGQSFFRGTDTPFRYQFCDCVGKQYRKTHTEVES